MLAVPAIRIFEDIICHRYYEGLSGTEHITFNDTIDEKLCKIDPIQAELAIIMGGADLADALPGVLLSFTFGLLADRYEDLLKPLSNGSEFLRGQIAPNS